MRINSNVEESQQMDAENDLLQGLDDMTIIDKEIEESSDEEDNDPCGETDGEDSGDGMERANMEEAINIDSLQDIRNLDMKNISPEDVKRCDFANLDLAYEFYSEYAKVNGFSVRKSKVIKNSTKVIVQKTYLCHREGERDKKRQNNKPKREAKRKTRCGCKARLRVHVDINSGRWYVTIFDHLHNHEMLGERLCAMLPAHRKMSPADIMEMNSLRNVGISTPDIYVAFASQSGGYHKIGFRKKDLYNQIGRQRRLRASDAITAIEYLEGLRAHDPYLYYRHTVDEEDRLQHLFWCDGICQMNYQLFGDVLAFDATYGKNKYRCPLVVFSGVNHHNRTTIFASAVVANETEDTYVWLLQKFNEVMKGKSPKSVITDSDMAMRNAIKRVFPNAHHRLCAWHLLRNATSNVGILDFISDLKRCMFSNIDVAKFQIRWDQMVSKFGLEDHCWVKELYEKRKMWASTHIRGNFFAGLRTTSRCESLHAQLGKFVKSRNNLTEFIQHFQRALNYMRFKEEEDDFASVFGEVVLNKDYHPLERSASKHFTSQIFLMFRKVLEKTSQIIVVGCREPVMCSIYTISKYQGGGREWYVSFYSPTIEFTCTCQKMECYGLPCEHIMAVLVYLDATEIPKSLILDRWTKIAKESIRGSFSDASYFWDSQLMARYVSLLELCRQLCNLAHHDDEDFNHIREIITSEIQILKDKHGAQFAQENTESQILDGNLRNPANVRSKGCGTRSGSGTTRGKRLNKCSVCGVACHNKKSCPQQRPVNDVDPSMCGNSMREVGEGSGLNNINLSVDPCCSRLNDNPPLQ